MTQLKKTSDCRGYYIEGELILDFCMGIPGPVLWANYLILMEPTAQVIPLWTMPLFPDIFDQLTIDFSFPSVGPIQIFTAFYSWPGVMLLLAYDLEEISTK